MLPSTAAVKGQRSGWTHIQSKEQTVSVYGVDYMCHVRDVRRQLVSILAPPRTYSWACPLVTKSCTYSTIQSTSVSQPTHCAAVPNADDMHDTWVDEMTFKFCCVCVVLQQELKWKTTEVSVSSSQTARHIDRSCGRFSST